MNKKEFYEYIVPEHRRSAFFEKVMEKTFSLISNILKGHVTPTEIEPGTLQFMHEFNGNEIYFIQKTLQDNEWFDKIPTLIVPTKINFRTGYVLVPHKNVKYAMILKNGQYESCNLDYTDILSLVYSDDHVEHLFYNHERAFAHAITENMNCWVDLKDNLRLCIKEFFPGLKRGMIFKGNSIQYKTTFEKVYNERYPRFQSYSVDLTEDIPLPPEDIIICRKGKFGCSHGCINDCLAKTVKKKNENLYKLFTKWQKLLDE